MTGTEYERFVRAVLVERLDIPPVRLRSTFEAGATLPGMPALEHQIDLIWFQENEVAEYITIIECKYRGTDPVDQPEIQNLAFVRDSVRAHKALMVTNIGFTSGARALAQSQKIALLVVNPSLKIIPGSKKADADSLFESMGDYLKRHNSCYTMTVVARFGPDPNQTVADSIDRLLADPKLRQAAESLLDDPKVREVASDFLSRNPDVAAKAMDFLKRRRW